MFSMTTRFVATSILCVVFAVSAFAIDETQENSESPTNQEPKEKVTSKQVLDLLLESPRIISDRDVGFITAKVLHGSKYLDYLKREVVVTEYPVEGLSEALGIQLFGVKLEAHNDELIACPHGKVQGLDIGFGLADIKDAAVLEGTLYVTHESRYSKGFLKVTAEEGALKVERRVVDNKNSSMKSAEDRKHIEDVLERVENKNADSKEANS